MAAVNVVQSVARLRASNETARSPPASQRMAYARCSPDGRPSGDSHDGGASHSTPVSAKMGPFFVFHTSNRYGCERPRTGMSAGVTSTGSHCPLESTRCLPTSIRSRNKSCTSAPVLVMPHATRALWPSTTNGTPGIVTPEISRPAATRCSSYQTEGNSIGRCGSFARIARPLFVFRPATTQLLELPRLTPGRSHSSPGGQEASTLRVSVGPASLGGLDASRLVGRELSARVGRGAPPPRIDGPSAG